MNVTRCTTEYRKVSAWRTRIARPGGDYHPHSFRYRKVQRVTLRCGARRTGGRVVVPPCNRATAQPCKSGDTATGRCRLAEK